jgi:hypothetical protein
MMPHVRLRRWSTNWFTVLLLAAAILVVRYYASDSGPATLATLDILAGLLLMGLMWSIYSPSESDPDARPVWRTLRWAAPLLFSFALTKAATRIWPDAHDALVTANLWLFCFVGLLLLRHAMRLRRHPNAIRPGVLALAAIGIAFSLSPAAILRDWARATDSAHWSTASAALMLLALLAYVVAAAAGVACFFWPSRTVDRGH